MKTDFHPPVRLKAVAELAGVSMTTASSVLNGHGPKLRIAAASIERVQQAAKALGYHANPFASGLRMKRSYSIGVLWSFNSGHSTDLVRHFSTQAMHRGYNALIYDSMSDATLMQSQIKRLKRWHVDGIIVQIAHPAHASYFQELLADLRTQANVLIVTNAEWALPFPKIIQSMESGLRHAIRHLLNSGRKQFAFLGQVDGNSTKIESIRRIVGMEMGLAPLTLLNCTAPDKDQVTAILAEAEVDAIDALLCGTDEIAATAISVLRMLGRRVPEEVAVIGFNDLPFSPLFNLPIASVRKYDALLAARAMEKMIASIETGEPLSDEQIDMDFIWRESAGGHPPLHP